MAKLSRLAGSTSHVLNLFIQDSTSTTGAGLTGLVFSSAGLTCYYKRNLATASTAVTLVTITTLGTYVSGGFKEVDAANMPGIYEFHPPDAVYASGAKSVAIMLKGATNMVSVLSEVELTGVDNQDGVRFGMTSLPNAAANATGGLPILTGTTLAYTVSTLTTYTGNTPQTGDNYARLGAAGAGLTAIGDIRLANLDATVTSRSTYAGGAVASVTASVTVGTNNDKTGYALTAGEHTAIITDVWTTAATRILTAGTNIALAKGTGVTGFTDAPALTDYQQRAVAVTLPTAPTDWITALSVSAGAVSKIQTGLSTYAGGAVASVTAPVTVATCNDKTGYSLAVAPPTAAQIATAVLTDTGDNTTAGSPGKILTQILGAFTGTSSVFTTAALVNAPTAPTVVQIRTEMDANSTKLANLDVTVSSRSTYALSQTLTTPRDLTSVADAALTVNDALHSAVAGAVGKRDNSTAASLVTTTRGGQVLATQVVTLATPGATVPVKTV